VAAQKVGVVGASVGPSPVGVAFDVLGSATLTLRLLAIPSALAGFWGIKLAYAAQLGAEHAAADHAWYEQLVAPFRHAPIPAVAGLLAVAIGFMAAYKLYWNAARDPLPDLLGKFAQAMRSRFYFDELYEKLIAGTQGALAEFADAFDRWIIAGLMVRGTHGTTELAGRALRLMQSGNLQTYAFFFVLGVALLLYFTLGS